MANRISDNIVKAFEKFNADLKAFGEETNEEYITLYEDANTTRMVKDFRLYKNGKLTWKEQELYGKKVTSESETMIDDYDAKEWLSFWRANLRRAKWYWAMNAETLDKIQDGEIENTTDSEEA